MKAIITIFMHGLHNDDKYLKQAETAAEAASLLAAIPKRLAHMPIADYVRRIWLPRILEVCKATTWLLETVGADLTKAWKQELSNRARTADETCKSEVVAFVCQNDETLQKIYGDDVPKFGQKSYLHAECLYFLCCRDNSLTESKRKDLEWNAKSRLSIQSTMFMIILENSHKVEPYADWLRRCVHARGLTSWMRHQARAGPTYSFLQRTVQRGDLQARIDPTTSVCWTAELSSTWPPIATDRPTK